MPMNPSMDILYWQDWMFLYLTASVTGKSVSAKPSKIVAGHEPDRTNDFLQCLAAAINVKVC